MLIYNIQYLLFNTNEKKKKKEYYASPLEMPSLDTSILRDVLNNIGPGEKWWWRPTRKYAYAYRSLTSKTSIMTRTLANLMAK